MSTLDSRIYDQGRGQDGLDSLRAQVSNLEQDLRSLTSSWVTPPITVAMGAAVYADNFPLRVAKPPGCRAARALIVARCEDLSGAAIASAPFADWVVGPDGGFSIRNITGLSSGRTYTISFLVVGD